MPDAPVVTIYTNEQDIADERKRMGCDTAFIQTPAPYLESIIAHRRFCEWAAKHNAIMFHSSAVAVEDRAYLFTAPPGVGKSTHVGLWRSVFGEKATVINDDKPIVRLIDSRLYACGSPWNGSHNLGSPISVPIAGICRLERGAQNVIVPLPAHQASVTVMSGTYLPPPSQGLDEVLEMIDLIVTQIPIWKLKCNMNPCAAVVSYEAMSGRK